MFGIDKNIDFHKYNSVSNFQLESCIFSNDLNFWAILYVLGVLIGSIRYFSSMIGRLIVIKRSQRSKRGTATNTHPIHHEPVEISEPDTRSERGVRANAIVLITPLFFLGYRFCTKEVENL